MFANAHTHLRGDLDTVIQRAKKNKVELILVAGADIQSSIDAVKIAKSYDSVYACVGVHPWNADKLDKISQKRLRDLAGEEKVVAISEIGLDFVGRMDLSTRSRSKPLPKELQMETFQNQIRLAKDVKLPIILHANGAHPEVRETLKQERASEVGGAIHGFNGDLPLAKEYVNLGFYISIGMAITTPDNVTLQNVVKGIPIERLLIETDGSDPSDIKDVAKKIAELKGISLEQVGHMTTSTLQNLIGL